PGRVLEVAHGTSSRRSARPCARSSTRHILPKVGLDRRGSLATAAAAAPAAGRSAPRSAEGARIDVARAGHVPIAAQLGRAREAFGFVGAELLGELVLERLLLVREHQAELLDRRDVSAALGCIALARLDLGDAGERSLGGVGVRLARTVVDD